MVAERFPELVKAIDGAGHEIACHSYLHRRIYTLTPEEFREDTKKAKDILEHITGKKVAGYITKLDNPKDALEVIVVDNHPFIERKKRRSAQGERL